MNPLWKVYKSKVLRTLNPEYEEDTAEEVQKLYLPMLVLQIHTAPELKSHQVLFADHF